MTSWRRALLFGFLAWLIPFVAGSVVGIPAGVVMLQWVAPESLRLFTGLLLVAFSVYNLAKPGMPVIKGMHRMADGIVGVLNGALGGATGLGGLNEPAISQPMTASGVGAASL